MKIQLAIADRFLLGEMIKLAFKQGNVVEMMTVDQLTKKIVFTEDEISNFKLEGTENGGVKWDPSTDNEIPVDLTPEQKDVLTKVYKHFDENKLVEPQMLSLLIKIKSLDE